VSGLPSDGEIRLARCIHDRSARCAVVGLGFIGTTLMDALAAAGFEAHGYDRLPGVVERFRTHASRRGLAGARPFSARSDPSALSGASIVIVAVRAIVGADGTADLEPLSSAADAIRAYPHPERLLILTSTVPPGTTRRFATDWLRRSTGDGTFVAHAPERLSVGHDWKNLKVIPHLVGGLDPASTRLAKGFLSCLCERVATVSAPEVSELSKLLENAFITVGVGLTGEIMKIANGLGISASEVCEAAATKTLGYYPFLPGPGVGGHCLPNDIRMLRAVATRLGWEAPLLAGASRVTAEQPRWIVDRLESLLAGAGGLPSSAGPGPPEDSTRPAAGRAPSPLRECRVLLVGVGFKIGTSDTTETPAREIVRTLRSRGAQPVYLDSQVPAFEVDGEEVTRIDARDLTDGSFPAGIVLAGDRSLEASLLRGAVRVLLDASGRGALRGDLEDAERI